MQELEMLTDETIESELAQPLPLLLDFGADWCEPCKALEPTLLHIAQAYEGRLRVLQVDLDEAPDIAERYRVMSIPTLLVVNGGEIEKIKAPLTEARIREHLDAALA